MKLNKKKVVALALAVCLIAILSLSSLAWFTDDDSVTNKFLVAGSEDEDPDDIFSVDVWEDATPEDPDGEDKIQEGIEYPNILPGDDLYKEANIENTGSYEQYIRATVTVSNGSVWQDVFGSYSVPLTEIVNIDTTALYNDTVISYYDAKTDSLVYVLYFEQILPVDGVYTVFNNVHINEKMDRDQAAAMAGGFDITVTADAVQTKNVGANVIEAFTTVGMYEVYPIAPADLQAALTGGAARVLLDPAADWSNLEINYPVSNVTLDANGTNANIVITGLVENLTIENLRDDAADAAVDINLTGAVEGSSVNVVNAVLTDTPGAPNGAIAVSSNCDLTVDGCQFIGTGAGKCYGIYGTSSANLTVTNSTFTGSTSWVFQVNGLAKGNVTVDNCVFETPKGVLKILSGVEGEFTFTNNAMIGCAGDGNDITKLVVTSSKNTPIPGTYSGNTLDGADWAQ